MALETLTLRQLNRATLARQLLLERSRRPPIEALEHLGGRQAQAAAAPFVGLWTRLTAFEPDDLHRALADRAVVKATMMRATLHLVSATDYRRFRSTIQPVLGMASAAIARERHAQLDTGRLLHATRAFLADGPRTFAEISTMLAETFPDGDVRANRYAVRTHLPLVQVPTDTRWAFPGQPSFALADDWLGHDVDVDGPPDVAGLLRRYLAAFGPAGVTDLQTWSGLADLKGAFDELRDELVVFRGEGRRELFDLPDAPRPDPDTPAPPRLLGEFDDVLLAHAKRTRIVADEHRRRVYLPALRVASTILVDGFVAGTWTVETKRKAATLTVRPFATLPGGTRAALEEEADALVRFLEPTASGHTVSFEKP